MQRKVERREINSMLEHNRKTSSRAPVSRSRLSGLLETGDSAGVVKNTGVSA